MDYTNKMKVIYGDSTLGLVGDNFAYLFSYERGGLESLKQNNLEWLYRVPTPSFWRATTDNDRGNGFNLRSAQWFGADMFSKCLSDETTLAIDGNAPAKVPIAPITTTFSNREYAKQATITFTYATLTVPSTRVTVQYTVKESGEMRVKVKYRGNDALPQLPVFGLRLIMPSVAEQYEYIGLSSETYPDRMTGAKQGKYVIKGLPVTNYLVPQENGMHMKTEQLIITRKNKAGKGQQLTIRRDGAPFNFSCLPYTAEELESATHIEELPLARRTVLLVAGAVRGVGGINSWGADVEPQYQISAGKDIEFSFMIGPARQK